MAEAIEYPREIVSKLKRSLIESNSLRIIFLLKNDYITGQVLNVDSSVGDKRIENFKAMLVITPLKIGLSNKKQI